MRTPGSQWVELGLEFKHADLDRERKLKKKTSLEMRK